MFVHQQIVHKHGKHCQRNSAILPRRATRCVSKETFVCILCSQSVPDAVLYSIKTFQRVRIGHVTHTLETCLEICNKIWSPPRAGRFLESISSRDTYLVPTAYRRALHPSKTARWACPPQAGCIRSAYQQSVTAVSW